MMYFVIETVAGDYYFVSVMKFADFDNLYSKLGIDEDDISKISRFTVHSLEVET